DESAGRRGMIRRRHPVLRLNPGRVTGSSAVLAANAFVLSGRAKAVLVVGLERMAQATSSQQVFNTIFDPVYEKDFPLTTITMAALRASMTMRLYAYTERHCPQIDSRSLLSALKNPLAHMQHNASTADTLT